MYLAGPISRLDYQGATAWREEARRFLDTLGIEGVSPMRHKEYLATEETIFDQYSERVMSTQKAITTRDFNDVYTCDAMLAFVAGATVASVGTVMEFGWAHAFRKPIVTVLDEGVGNPHDHAMVREVSGFVVPTLEEALGVVGALLR